METSDTHINEDDAAFVVNTGVPITNNKNTKFINIWLFLIGAFIGALTIAIALTLFPPSCMCPLECPLGLVPL